MQTFLCEDHYVVVFYVKRDYVKSHWDEIVLFNAKLLRTQYFYHHNKPWSQILIQTVPKSTDT